MGERSLSSRGLLTGTTPSTGTCCRNGFQAPSAHISPGRVWARTRHQLQRQLSGIGARDLELFLFVAGGEVQHLVQGDRFAVLLPPLRFAIATLEELDRSTFFRLQVDDDVDRILR